jgi:hypothetical protein
MYTVLALVALLWAAAVYFAWRGSRFGAARGKQTHLPDDETSPYLKSMAELVAAQEVRFPNLGSGKFDEAAYLDLLARLDGIQPSKENRYYSQHVAYRGAVAHFVERRRRTAVDLEAAGSLIRRVGGFQVADCRSARETRELMSNYGRSVDPRIDALLEDCEAESLAYDAVQERLADWDVAMYKFRYGSGQE